MHPKAQCGYWKMRVGRLEDKRWAPVAIYLSSGELHAMVGSSPATILESGAQGERALALWARCGREPISYDAYGFAVREGRFPGELLPSDGIVLDNYADDPNSKFRDDLVVLIGKVEKFIKSLDAPLTQESADSLANYMDMLRTAVTTGGELLKEEIEAQKKEIANRKSTWAFTLDSATDLVNKIRELVTPYLRAKKAAGNETPRIGGQKGKRIGLATLWKARVDDWDRVMVEYHNDPQVRELIQKLLDARARAKDRENYVIDGVTFYEEEVAR
jgi:hypothetical protein